MSETGASALPPPSEQRSLSTPAAPATSGGGDASLGDLVTQLSQDTTRLVRDEMRLAVLEVQGKAKSAGLGAGLFGAGGLFGFLGLETLVATAVIALDLVLALWLSALIVVVVLFAIAAVAALIGKKKISQATPAAPERTIENVKRDVAAVKEHDHHA